MWYGLPFHSNVAKVGRLLSGIIVGLDELDEALLQFGLDSRIAQLLPTQEDIGTDGPQFTSLDLRLHAGFDQQKMEDLLRKAFQT